MAGEVENFHGKGFHTNPENINRNGRPKSLTTKFKEQLEAEGVTGVNSANIIDTYTMLLDLKVERLQQIANDREQPLIVRMAALHLTDKGKHGWDSMNQIIDRLIGKPKQQIDANFTGDLNIRVNEDKIAKFRELERQFGKPENVTETPEKQ